MSARTTAVRAACAVALVSPFFLHAQDTTRVFRPVARVLRDTVPLVTSQRRILVQKDGRSEVTVMTPTAAEVARADSIASAATMERERLQRIALEAARTDSIARAVTDSIARARTDSIARVARIVQDSIDAADARRRAEIARADSIALAEQRRRTAWRERQMFDGSGWYVGLSAGGAVPTGDFADLGYDGGYNVNVPIGWHSRNHFLGIRLDLGYSQFTSGTFTGIGGGGAPVVLNNRDPRVLSAALDLTAQVPLNASHSISLYALGGGGLYHFRNFGQATALGGFLGNDVLAAPGAGDPKTRNKIGAQLGAGIDFGIGPASLFLETRVVNVFADRNDNVRFSDFFGDARSKNVRWVPILLGVNFR
jgi:Outer membrane protein beta-barrel domain